MLRPSNQAAPAVGSSSRTSRRASVDLPQPDSPTMPSVSPRARVKLTPSTALTVPTWRLKSTPRVSGKCFARFSTHRSGSSARVVPGRSEAAIEHLPGEVAGADPSLTELDVGRDFGRTDVLPDRAARVERAAGRDAREARRQALDGAQRPAARPAVPRNRLDERPRIGVGRALVD